MATNDGVTVCKDGCENMAIRVRAMNGVEESIFIGCDFGGAKNEDDNSHCRKQ